MYEIIQYRLDLGLYERLNTGIANGSNEGSNDQLFIHFQVVGTKPKISGVQCQC